MVTWFVGWGWGNFTGWSWYYYALPPRVGALSDDAHLTSVCLSVAYIGPKSRTERSRKTEIGREVAYDTHDSDTTFKVKGQLAGCWGIVAASRTACWWRDGDGEFILPCRRLVHSISRADDNLLNLATFMLTYCQWSITSSTRGWKCNF